MGVSRLAELILCFAGLGAIASVGLVALAHPNDTYHIDHVAGAWLGLARCVGSGVSGGQMLVNLREPTSAPKSPSPSTVTTISPASFSPAFSNIASTFPAVIPLWEVGRLHFIDVV